MVRWLMPDIPLVVGRRRVLAAELVRESFPNAVLLMDDGLQHLPLRKQIEIVLDDPEPRNTFCLPAGPYREPRGNLHRADRVIWNRKPSSKSQFWLHRARNVFVAPDGSEVEPMRATALCALGQPEPFLQELAERLDLVEPLVLPDHDPLTGDDILGRLPADLPVLVTAKDWVKLRRRADVGSRRFLIAMQKVEIEPAAEFNEWLSAELEKSPGRLKGS
jgi:tetraacyldisaccharide 4'-kinase